MKRIAVTDLPATDTVGRTAHYGRVDYVVPADTVVMAHSVTGDRVYAEPNNHVHGYRASDGVTVITVYCHTRDCGYCQQAEGAL